jgi:hypothetical protein
VRQTVWKKMPRKPGRFVIKVKKEAYQAAGLLKEETGGKEKECSQELACKTKGGTGLLQCQTP